MHRPSPRTDPRSHLHPLVLLAALAVALCSTAGCGAPPAEEAETPEIATIPGLDDARLKSDQSMYDAAIPLDSINPDAPVDSIETEFKEEGEDKWVEWFMGYGPTGRQASLPINSPPVVLASDADHMRDDDAVIGVLVGDQARAYPWWVMTSGHLVNDVLGGIPVVVTMCERCSGVGAFRAEIAGRMLDFRLRGLHEGTWFCADFQTDSFWHPFAGEAWRGPLEGRKLERLRHYQTTWGKWKKDHPHSTVLLGSEEMRDRRHSRWGERAKAPGDNPDLDPERLQPTEPNPRKDWMPGGDVIFGLRADAPDHGKAYPIQAIADAGGLIQEEYDGKPVLIVLRAEYQVGAYNRQVGDSTLEFSVHSESPFRLVDQNGTLWDEWGQAVEGPDKGEILQLLDGYFTEWYEWLYMASESELYGREERQEPTEAG